MEHAVGNIDGKKKSGDSPEDSPSAYRSWNAGTSLAFSRQVTALGDATRSPVHVIRHIGRGADTAV